LFVLAFCFGKFCLSLGQCNFGITVINTNQHAANSSSLNSQVVVRADEINSAKAQVAQAQADYDMQFWHHGHQYEPARHHDVQFGYLLRQPERLVRSPLKRGDVLVRIDDRDAKIALAQAEAELAKAKRQYKQRQQAVHGG
jgi:multidrug resistance efflux pump